MIEGKEINGVSEADHREREAATVAEFLRGKWLQNERRVGIVRTRMVHSSFVIRTVRTSDSMTRQ